ncbi:class II aldolase/adducin family protein [Rhodovibrionaceae bacterium A322]
MALQWHEERQELIATVCRMNALGINQGTSGNASVRVGAGFLITPSGLAYEDIAPEDVVEMQMDGSFVSANGLRKPSSEWRFHLDVLAARPEFNALVHTHGKAVASLSCLRRDIPAFHYMVALAGGTSIRCADYATFGTQALSDKALVALEDRKACLLANHGQLAAGASLRQALSLAQEVETLADMYWRALQMGTPVILNDDEMAEVIEKFNKGYGSGKAFVAPSAGAKEEARN